MYSGHPLTDAERHLSREYALDFGGGLWLGLRKCDGCNNIHVYFVLSEEPGKDIPRLAMGQLSKEFRNHLSNKELALRAEFESLPKFTAK